MFSSDTTLGIFLTSQCCIGVIGNSLIFLSSLYTFSVQHYLKKPIDSIFMHLTMVNILAIVFLLIPDIASSFGIRHFLSDAGCKAVLYIYRVTRGLSICTTSILSTFQAITISPSNSTWAWLKPKLSTWTPLFFIFSWLINMLIYIEIIKSVIAKTNATLAGHGYYHAYCQNRNFGKQNKGLFLSVILTRDLIFVALMLSTSLYMVNFLYRHYKRAKQIHIRSLSSQSSPETRATWIILLLVSCFVFFYWLSNFVTLYGFYTPEKIPRLEQVNAILSSSYPTICPFLLMRNNKNILHFTSSLSVLRITHFQRSNI
uniref:putative vomeronasal receptor-like protein 4 n=1 Tax=Jaculus jaculus TaxID=51337 RepID=UPI001E1B1945|nr:putative vomeronasal receptor-like protein 4 [Jaculus jaculus]